jgi:hypothetical protein
MGSHYKLYQDNNILPPAGGDPVSMFEKPAQKDVLDFEKLMESEPTTEIQKHESGASSDEPDILVIDHDQIHSEVMETGAGEDLFQRSLDSIEQLQDEWVRTIGKLEQPEFSAIGVDDNIDSYVGNMKEMADSTRQSLFVATKYQTITSFGSIILQQLGNLMSFIKS